MIDVMVRRLEPGRGRRLWQRTAAT
jgi:hypothetical protein